MGIRSGINRLHSVMTLFVKFNLITVNKVLYNSYYSHTLSSIKVGVLFYYTISRVNEIQLGINNLVRYRSLGSDLKHGQADYVSNLKYFWPK